MITRLALPGRVLSAQLNRAYWGELAWVIIGAPLTLAFVALVAVGLLLGAGLSLLTIGVPVLIGVLAGARLIGIAHIGLARALLGTTVTPPARPELRPGLWNGVKGRLGDPLGWRSVAYLVIRLPLSLIEFFLVASLFVYAVSTLSYPLFWFTLNGEAMPTFDLRVDTWPLTLPLAATGLAVLLAMPWVVRGLTEFDRLLVRGVLGAEDLSKRVRDLERSRATAVDDATRRLRRIERDLHDGAQAQLVALAMKLGIAKDELAGDGDIEQVTALITAAHANAKQALVELRDLARGIHPAALDAGLDVALSTLAAGSGIDARITVDLPSRPSPSIETIAYFTVAELLTNAAKHTSSAIEVDVGIVGDDLRLVVRDGGEGGARPVRGGGLAGIAERLATVDGGLDIDSPVGGPTVISAGIPLRK
ncbi:sensor histidine kinase [Amycolatopsis keratiniphila]|uniref:sensor histidine kinase n=1 Tax=Amycolatopsis keratiniphila TaxID=129921 RepID=UPI00087A137F|nr:sensor histidine kinase [Amycolatopsis keratiniphila]OLZ43919.1 histidine kinase [Amycolatopsis keratiniphila subsp. nogabecina]SDU71306.1 Signal transduction histidine kinase [Amycolatopsis keratiniphila]